MADQKEEEVRRTKRAMGKSVTVIDDRPSVPLYSVFLVDDWQFMDVSYP